MTTTRPECDCTDEYGPCEQHCETLVIREGASLRSADELTLIYLDDALALDPECLAPYGQSVKAEAEAPEAWDGSWLKDPDLADALRDVAWQVESYLSPLWTLWNDGYVIVRPSADCPLIQD